MNEFFDIVRPLVEFQFNSILSRSKFYFKLNFEILNFEFEFNSILSRSKF